VRQTIYFDHTDGRMLFAVPRGGVTYIGTTDTDYDGNKDEPEATAADVNYLLDAINHMFLGLGLRPDDVESTWAGLRPLIHEPGKSASEVSRKDEIFVSDRRLISIAGGKLTGYRKMAERVVDRVFEELELPVFAVRTHRIRLKNAEFNTYQDVSDFVIKLGNTYAEYFNGRTNAAYFVHNYGRAAEAILERAKLLQGSHALLRAELEFTVEHEMVQTALDFIERRTGRLNFDSAYVVQHARTIVEILTELLKWDAARAREELERIDTAVTRVNRWREAIATEWSK
jgi:glycerol-3-phosphate dehydrogenase